MPEPLYTHHGGASDSTVSLPSPSDTSSEPRHNSSPIHAYEHVPEHEDDLQSQASPPLSPTDRQPHAAVLATTADKAASTHRNEKSSPTTAAKRVLASVKRIISNEKVGDEQMARSLNGMRYHKANSIVLDVVLCLLPIAFVVIATLALSLHDAPKSPSGERVHSYTLLAPTVFPIVYAAILGRTLKRIGLFLAEKGSTIGTLERIVGCQSLFSAIERQYTLRHVDALGVLILLVWLLSPVGGQSSLRLLTYEPRTIQSTDAAWFYPMQAFIWVSLLDFNNAFRFHHISVPYMAALQSSTQTTDSSTDMWGNLKIPDVRYLKAYGNITTIGDWVQIDNDTDIVYTSLLGLPVFGLSTSGNMTFNLTSHYWSVDCDRAVRDDHLLRWWPSDPTLSTYALATSTNDTAKPGIRTLYSSRKALMLNNTMTYVANATCYAEPVLVETQIACRDTACRAQAVRELPWHDDLSDQRAILYSNYTDVLRNMTTADLANTRGGAMQSQLTEAFIGSEIVVAGYSSKLSGNWVSIEDLPHQILSSRLQQAINTYWDASVGNMLRSWEHQPREKPPSVCIVPLRRWVCEERGLNWNVTQVQSTTHSGVQYACNSGYAVITIAISCFLFLAAVLSLVLGTISTAPDILGYVSSAARYNVHFGDEVPSHLDGLEAAKQLRDVKVIIGDVAGDDEVGRVAFASLDHAPRKLVRDRMYA